jgi:hypothetical protein
VWIAVALSHNHPERLIRLRRVRPVKPLGLALGESLAAQPEPGALLILPFGGPFRVID